MMLDAVRVVNEGVVVIWLWDG